MAAQSSSRDQLIDDNFSATSTAVTSMHAGPLISNEHFFGERQRTATSISPEQALINMVKVMMGTGLVLLIVICTVCLYCCRQLVFASAYLRRRKGVDRMDYANVSFVQQSYPTKLIQVMRSALENGPACLQQYGYVGKQLVNSCMIVAQLGFCCVYFVFMSDNLKQFFDETSDIRISQAGWIALLLIPILGLCTIRQLKVLAPLALIGNMLYLAAVFIVFYYLLTNLQPMSSVNAVGTLSELPLFFAIVVFAFEGIAVVLPIENQMDEPQHFISNIGVLNTACLLVFAVYTTMGFYGYLAFGASIKDTVTLNLPKTGFYQVVRILFVGCILVSYPLQFYVPIERIEKYISRKVPEERQNFFIYFTRYSLVILTCLFAELIPHLALFIALIGAFAGTALALLFPPCIDLLCNFSRKTLTWKTWTTDLVLFGFGLLGFTTGTYSSIRDIAIAFGQPDDV